MSTITSFSPSPSFDSYPAPKLTWNRNEDVYRILEAAAVHGEWLSGSVHERPPSGTQLLFSRSQVDFKNDGYEWTRRKDGRLIREDHMKLKVKKMDVIHANYAHSAIISTFHRRAYSLISNPDIVLVHYLKSEETDETGVVSFSGRISDSIRKNGLNPTLSQLLTQMEPILSPRCMNKTEIEYVAQEVMENLRREAETKLNRRNSCSSASRRGLSSVILARQPSAFSDSVDTQFGSGVKREWNERNNGNLYERDGGHSRSHSGDTGNSSDEMATDWSRIERVNGPTPSCSDWSTFNSEWSTSFNQGPSTSADSPTLSLCPGVTSTKGGDRVVIMGGWFVRGPEYSVVFGDKRTSAILVQDGVIQVVTPPGKGKISIRVLSDETPIGPPLDFFYRSCTHEDATHNNLLQALIDRVHLLCAAFNSPANIESMDPDSILSVVDSLKGRPLVFPYLINSSFPSRTILHLASALDFYQLIQRILYRREDFPTKYREFDINAKDVEGETPLTIALADRNRCAVFLATEAGWSLHDLDRESERLRSESVSMRGPHSMDDEIACHRDEDDEMCDGPARSTEAWVISHRETMMEGREGMRGEEMGSRVPLEISMDTEVLVPDSPTMANLFQAVTSPGMVDDNARDQMAILTKRLIDALPSNVKISNGVIHNHVPLMSHPHIAYSNCDSMSHGETSMRSGNEYQNDPMVMGYVHHNLYDGHMHHPHDGFFNHYTHPEVNPFSSMLPSTSFGVDNISIGELDVELEEKDLGDFLSGSNTILMDVDPLQKKLETLKLNPKEQRDVYEAALLMSDFVGGSSPNDSQRNAATTIQTCYRRYKQYCYLRRLHNAAVVVQKHFRLRRANQREEAHDEVQEHPSMQGESICIQVPNRSLSREHWAAATIQNAYRGHRKRQAAARKIQKFMRQTRQKLRKKHEANDDVCTGDGTT
ncbi:hypothetical protein PENTCL1PPCAC_6928 [Pristionchus entomophagus]|uniref:CG-1 domain-containing protein n=1 Tax=Pristionchus entomophagus TaxID=358040 RepID=A0AAV5SNQ5_9BILA|nr:hypothetical protein PENTCL1PPCAC_6928 [Pristionchus entomophagus]